MKQVASRANPLFRLLLELAESSRARREQGLTLLDGANLLETYARRGGRPRRLAVSASGAGQADVLAALARFPGVDTILLPDALFGRVSQVTAEVGVLGVIPIPAAAPSGNGFAILMEDLQDPGNVGAILRSAAAAGASDAYLSPGCAEPWSPKVLRAGMGGHFFLAVHGQADLVSVAGNWPGSVIATAADAPQSVFDAQWRRPVAVVIGNEGAGISPGLLATAGLRVRVPMPGGMESLNAAAAAAVCLFEVVRRQQAARRRVPFPGPALGGQ